MSLPHQLHRNTPISNVLTKQIGQKSKINKKAEMQKATAIFSTDSFGGTVHMNKLYS
jgi:hypothetical protein